MNIKNISIFFAIVMTFASQAQTSEELAKSKSCMACHAIDAKVVGPAYRDVAAKYAAQANAEEVLVQKVLKGGKGVWGFMPMPANTQVTEEEAHNLVKWILSLK